MYIFCVTSGDLSLALEPMPSAPSQETSLDVTATEQEGSTLQEPTFPGGVPQVLRDMTNVQKPGKKPGEHIDVTSKYWIPVCCLSWLIWCIYAVFFIVRHNVKFICKIPGYTSNTIID